MHVLRPGFVILVLLCGARVATANEPRSEPAHTPRTPEQVAADVVEAVQADDTDGLRALAEPNNPDPWLVVDELSRRAEHDAAVAYASAAPRPDVAKLPAYAESCRERGDEADRRRLLLRMRAAVAAGRPAEAVEESDEVQPDSDVLSVRIPHLRAIALAKLGRLEESQEMLLEVARIAAALGWLRAAAAGLHGAGEAAYRRRDFRTARKCWLERLAVERQREDARGEYRALHNLGKTALYLGLYDEALARYERVLALAEPARDRAVIAAATGNLGEVFMRLGRLAEAEAYTRRSLEVNQALAHKPGVAMTVSTLGQIQFMRGKLKEALASQERALFLFEALGDRAGLARVWDRTGITLCRLGEYRRGIEMHERALAFHLERGNDGSAAFSRGNLGTAYLAVGELEKAREHMEQALSTAERAGDLPQVATHLHNLGCLARRRGAYDEALDLLQRALVIREQLGERGNIARTLSNLGSIRLLRGEYAEALTYVDRALELRRAMGDRLGVAHTLRLVGGTYERLADDERALAALREALQIFEAAGAKMDAATTLGEIAIVHYRRGEYEEALTLAERVLEAQRRLGDDAGVAVTLANLGNIHYQLGDFEAAARFQALALEASEEREVRAGDANGLFNLALSKYRLGELEAAMALCERACELAREAGAVETEVLNLWALAGFLLNQDEPARAAKAARAAVELTPVLVRGLAEEQGARGRELWGSLFEVGAQAAHRAGSVEEAWFFIESGRAGTLLESLRGRDALRRATIPEPLLQREHAARQAVAEARSHYARVRQTGVRKDSRTARAALTATQRDLLEAVERIQRSAKAAADVLYPTPSPLQDLQAVLGSDEAYVAFLTTIRDPIALVVTRAKGRTVGLGAADEIAAACEVLRTLSSSKPAGSAPASAGAHAEATRTLRDLVVAPLALSPDVERLLVSTDGALCYVPFSMLTRRDVVQVPSGTTYQLLYGERELLGRGVLGLGDPDYEARGVHDLPALPGSRAEVDAVADVKLLGASATKAELRIALEKRRRWRAIHFACHGLVDPTNATLSSLALTPDSEGDGLLSALEIFTSKMPADLVVLSACETGKGKVYRAEGLVGFTRACMMAGAPRVIVSLWKVDDEATRALMVKFYELWDAKEGEGMGAMVALRKAQAFVRGHPDHPEWQHPYYWAAWVLWGLPD